MVDVLQELFPFLVVLYAVDLVRWVGAGHRLFSGARPGFFRVAGPGLRLTSPEPGAWLFPAHRLPLMPSREALWVGRRPGLEGRPRLEPRHYERIPWSGLAAITADGAWVRAGRRRLARTPTPLHAVVLARRLEAVRRAGEGERAEELAAQAARSFDLATVEQAVGRVAGQARPVRVGGAALFLLLFVALPMVLYLPLLYHVLVPLLLLAVATWLLLAALLFRLDRQLVRLGVPRPAGSLVGPLLFPPSAPRAVAGRCAYLVAGWDLLAVAVALLPPEEAVRHLRAARYEVALALDPPWKEAGPELSKAEWDDWRRAWSVRRRGVEAVVETLRQAGRVDDEALRVPPDLGEAAAFCPLCASRFRRTDVPCDECGVPLVAGAVPGGSAGS